MADISIYEGPGGAIEVRVAQETVWLTQAQMVELFARDQSVISRHVRNVFSEGELEKGGNMQKMHIAGSDKPVAFYNLDVIISVGYRVKSPAGVRFRQWATRTVKEHLTRGYTLNRQRFENKARELEVALNLPILRWSRRLRISCTSSSRTIRSAMATSASVRSCLWIFCIATTGCSRTTSR